MELRTQSKRMLWNTMQRAIFATVCICAATLISCSNDSSNGGGAGGTPSPTNTLAFVTTTNFTDSGSYSIIDLENYSSDVDLPSQAGIIESDNDAVYFNNKVYVINRLGFDNITVLDVSDLSTAIKQFSTGNGSNPYDMAFVSDSHAYVCVYEENDILRVDPTAAAGNEIVARIDLSGFATLYNDPDGIVEAAQMVIVDDYLFVALQLVDRNNFFSPTATSALAVIDTTTDQLVDVDPATGDVDAIVLTGQNPQFMLYDSDLDKILVSEIGSYSVNDGGIEAVDPLNFVAEGFITKEADLGGDMGDFVTVDGLRGYAVISFMDASFNFFNKVVIFDLANGDNLGDLTDDLPFIPSLALDGNQQILVPDRTSTAPGIRIYDASTDTEVVTSPIDVGLPPSVVIVLDD